MADAEEPESDKPKRLDRRALLLGAAAGAAGAAALGAGMVAVREQARALVTPAALPAGQAAQIARSFRDSRPAAEAVAKAPAGAPNIVVIVLDDVGFGDLGCFGGEIRTPAMDALAANGLRYANFRTCAMCSPTRAALLTGLNHHSAGMGWLADIDSGYPGYRGDLTHEAATLAEVLREAGWSTLMIGKWHLNSAASTGANGPYDNWPTSRGFERAYWFQGHSTDYFKPCELFDGIAPVEPPERPDYFACDDFTDRAIEYLRTQKALSPDKPFLLYVGYPGAHSPLQARARERYAYRGAYDAGWDVVRAARLERQRRAGLVPDTTSLPPLSPGAQSWDTLSAQEQRLYARYMEVYAALVTNVDANIARLLATLDDLGARDNTLIMVFSDNGGSAEGTPTGTPNVFAPAFGRPVPVPEASRLFDVMGEDGTFPHYPIGWSCASNTPFRMYKQYAHLGGVADPLIVAWPQRIAARGEASCASTSTPARRAHRDGALRQADRHPRVSGHPAAMAAITARPLPGIPGVRTMAPCAGAPQWPTSSYADC
jgi:arylsulfatase